MCLPEPSDLKSERILRPTAAVPLLAQVGVTRPLDRRRYREADSARLTQDLVQFDPYDSGIESNECAVRRTPASTTGGELTARMVVVQDDAHPQLASCICSPGPSLVASQRRNYEGAPPRRECLAESFRANEEE